MKLNPQQQAAVEYTQGPLLVLAGAGSGKTRVITEKIAWLVGRQQLSPSKIAAITFTNKAAKEMRERVSKRLGERDLTGLTVCTFHALGWRILRSHAEDLGFRKSLTILDDSDAQQMVRDLIGGTVKPDLLQLVRNQIGRWKNRALTASAAQAEVQSEGEGRIWQLYQRYEEQLRKINAVDFDDLIMLPVQLLRQESCRTRWQETFRYLLVDEYQDTNASQYELLKLLAGPRGALTAVGDDDQSIYGWRGAQPENLTQLGEDYPALKVIKLEQNYRSTGKVLAAANAVIANNPHEHTKRLWSALPEGDDLRVIPCKDEDDEARRVVGELLHRQFTSRARHGEFAILYRGNHQSRAFERALREQRIPYHLSGGTSFFERSEIKDLLAYFRLLVNPDDNSAFLRVINTPRREIGARTQAIIGEHAGRLDVSLFEAAVHPETITALTPRARDALRGFCNMVIGLGDRGERGDPVAVTRELVDNIHYESWLRDQCDKPQDFERRWQNVQELLSWIEKLHQQGDARANLTDLMAQLSLLTSLDADEDPGQQVRLMTLHAAKGLEFPYVFMVGVEEGILPHRASLEEGAEEEERRLMYVGITRAERALVISYSSQRKRYGEMVRCEPSRFLEELPRQIVSWEGGTEAKDKEASSQRAKAHLDSLRAMFAND